MGAALKRSPAQSAQAALFAYPEVRQWLSFSPERCHPRALALIGGVASANSPPDLRPFLRPLSKTSATLGHLHAAVFSYRPLQKGRLELKTAVKNLFDAGGLQGVLHLFVRRPRNRRGRRERTVARRLLGGADPPDGRPGGDPMSLLMSAWSIGFILSLLALGVYVSFRVFDFPDITAEGSITLGAAVAAVLLVHGWPPLAATFMGSAAGLVSGALTGVLAMKFQINRLLAGILTMTAL